MQAPVAALHQAAARIAHSALSSRRCVAAAPAPAQRLRCARPRRAAIASAEAVAPFEFASANRIVFGRGEALKKVPAFAKSVGGTHALIVVGSSTTRAQPFADALTALGVKSSFFSIGAPRAAALAGGFC